MTWRGAVRFLAEHLLAPMLAASVPVAVEAYATRDLRVCQGCRVRAPRISGRDLARLGWGVDDDLRLVCPQCRAHELAQETTNPGHALGDTV
jgi:hypothetical protein